MRKAFVSNDQSKFSVCLRKCMRGFDLMIPRGSAEWKSYFYEKTMTENDWRSLALWLLDCEAATTEHLLYLKSASKSEIRRHKSICKSAVNMIKSFGQLKPEGIKYNVIDMERILNRATFKEE